MATEAVPPTHGGALQKRLRQPPALHGIRRARWRLCDRRQVVPWLRRSTLPGLCQLLPRLRIRWKRGRLRGQSPDRAYAPKLAWIARAHHQARAQPAHVRLCSGAEFSLYRPPPRGGTEATSGTEPTAPGRCQFLTALRRAYPTPTRLRGWANGPLHQHPTVLARAAQEAIPLLWRPT